MSNKLQEKIQQIIKRENDELLSRFINVAKEAIKKGEIKEYITTTPYHFIYSDKYELENFDLFDGYTITCKKERSLYISDKNMAQIKEILKETNDYLCRLEE